MPPLTAAQRMQGAAAPAKRNWWGCPHCGEQGWGEWAPRETPDAPQTKNFEHLSLGRNTT